MRLKLLMMVTGLAACGAVMANGDPRLCAVVKQSVPEFSLIG